MWQTGIGEFILILHFLFCVVSESKFDVFEEYIINPRVLGKLGSHIPSHLISKWHEGPS